MKRKYHFHGHAPDGGPSPTYKTWAGMKRRCLNPKNKDFQFYGGRGIEVCETWLEFPNFLADMGEKPEGLTLERIDNDGNYEPRNCKWASQKDQIANRRPYLVPATQGERNWGHKLTAEDIRKIRADPAPTPYQRLANIYGVTRGAIRKIILGQTWRHIT